MGEFRQNRVMSGDRRFDFCQVLAQLLTTRKSNSLQKNRLKQRAQLPVCAEVLPAYRQIITLKELS